LQSTGKGSILASSNIDQNHDGIIGPGDYTVSGGVVTFTGTALSSSNPAFQSYVDIFDDGVTGTHYYANGNGLANALDRLQPGPAGDRHDRSIHRVGRFE